MCRDRTCPRSGVESIVGVEDPVAVAQNPARRWGAVVAITGKRDIIGDGERALGVRRHVRGGSPLRGGCRR
ncbi:MAG: hydroxyethylthiazole kinase [Bacillota bacterium]